MNGAGLGTKVSSRSMAALSICAEKAGDTAAVPAAKTRTYHPEARLLPPKIFDALKEGIEKNSNETEQAAIRTACSSSRKPCCRLARPGGAAS